MPLRYSHFIVKHPICHIHLYINTIIVWMLDWGRGWATRTHKTAEQRGNFFYVVYTKLWKNYQIFYFTKSMFCFRSYSSLSFFFQLDLLRASQWPPGFCVRDQLKTFFAHHTSFSQCLSLVVQKEKHFPYGANIKYFQSYKSSCKYSEYS